MSQKHLRVAVGNHLELIELLRKNKHRFTFIIIYNNYIESRTLMEIASTIAHTCTCKHPDRQSHTHTRTRTHTHTHTHTQTEPSTYALELII